MIVPMKKYSFLIFYKEYIPFLENLQDLGMLHVIEKESGEIGNEELRERYQQLKDLNDTIQFLKTHDITEEKDESIDDAIALVEEIKKLQEEYEHTQLHISSLNKDIASLTPWGNFSWENIERLALVNLRVRFFTCSSRQFNQLLNSEYHVEQISDISGFTYFVLLQEEGETVEINAEELKLPKQSMDEIIQEKEALYARLEEIEKTFEGYASKYISALEIEKQELTAKLDFNKVVLHTEKTVEDKLMLLEGWVPEENENELIDFLEKSGVYYESKSPEEKDSVPIKLKNNRFARLFEMIGELYSMPDYKELDLTPFFAPFFMLFFGFCLGDAGYGLLFLIGATLYKFKAPKEIKPVLTLVQFLGLATILFGALTGTIFGINLIDTGYIIKDQSIALLQHEHIPMQIIEKLKTIQGTRFETKLMFENAVTKLIGEESYNAYDMAILKYTEADYSFLNSFRYLLLDSQKMFNLSLIIGGVQIIFGMVIKMANQIIRAGIKYSLATLGWLFLILGSLTLFGLLKLNVVSADNFKPVIFVILGISSLGIFLFNDPKRNILVNIGAGIWDTYNMITGILGDLLSYIRLFALGISSAILGFVFNSLAVEMSPGIPVVGQLVMVIILVIGHGINIFMASLGSFVHPLRLTFVEFYKNAGFTGGGEKYQPFSK